MSAPDPVVQRRDEVEDYEQTVKVLLAFAALAVHDGKKQRAGSDFGLGRRMRTSPSNAVSPSADITPDLVAQRSQSYGLVAEVKKSLPKDQERWRDCATQLRKYDDDLDGWWTDSGLLSKSDAILLIHISRSRQFVQYLQSLAQRDPECLGPNTCVVEFTGVQERAFYYLFRLEQGQLRDPELQGQLYESRQVPFDKVIQSFASIHYYDSEPPLEVILTDLWVDVFPSLLDNQEYDERTRTKRLQVTLSRLVEEMQAAYGSGALSQDGRAASFPRTTWIRKALDSLVRYGLASVVEGSDGDYVIHYRPFRDDVLERFIELRQKKGEGLASDGLQGDLFRVKTDARPKRRKEG